MKTDVTRALTMTTVAGLAVSMMGLLSADLAAAASPATQPGLTASAAGASAAAQGKSIAGYDFKAALNQGSSTFKVPTVTCTTSDLQGIGLGLGIEDVVGTPTSLATVFVACVSGAPLYQMSATANGVKGTGDATDVHAGDSVTVSYKITGSNLTVTTKDAKTGASVSATGAATPAESHLTFGSFPLFAAGSDDPLPVSDFGTASLSKIKVNAKTPAAGKKLTDKDIKTRAYAKGSFTLRYTG